MEIRHFPPAGQSLIAGGHNTQEPLKCRCNPERTPVYKRSATGRFGRHQGRTIIRMEWRHNRIEVPDEEQLPALTLVPSDARLAAREDAWFANLEANRP